ncbi:rab9 effector protein with kelch motifs [Erpetoichthys calabaricus]|uniref:rab9 effector protein with kelch motifs n=1 Tax=Erpetoichthys calabaricus TaxID=27687 RepID=UPI0010A0AEE7|nr:rab9 effector protein with kelch motifs [Erpetoichthys calabaricus]
MALASGHWVDKTIKGEPPSPRYGQAIAVAGNIVFFFGGVSNKDSLDGQPRYFNDFYILTVTPSELHWESMPQNGQIPSPREGHSLCLIRGKLFLFGGCSNTQAEECIPGVYCFDISTLMWEKLKTSGMAPKTLKHSSAAVGENIYVFGGVANGIVRDNLLVFNTVAMMWTPVQVTGCGPSARFSHTCALVGEQIYVFGGCYSEDIFYNDVHILETGTLTWTKCEVKGEIPRGCAGQSFTAHHDKDIYLFGGNPSAQSSALSATNDIFKLSIAKMKWKVPLYVGIPPSRRHGHSSFILHSHMYIFGGVNEEQEFNDLKVMKLINPSERQPIMKEILSGFGIHGVSNRFTPTKVPKVKYELTEAPFPIRIESPPPIQPTNHRDFTTIRNQTTDLITKVFTELDNEFQKLDNEKMLLSQEKFALQLEKEAYKNQHEKQQQELQEMIGKHKTQNEAWLKARAEENDRERKELSKLREDVLREQEKLKEEQIVMEKRSEQLCAIMKQFKGL